MASASSQIYDRIALLCQNLWTCFLPRAFVSFNATARVVFPCPFVLKNNRRTCPVIASPIDDILLSRGADWYTMSCRFVLALSSGLELLSAFLMKSNTQFFLFIYYDCFLNASLTSKIYVCKVPVGLFCVLHRGENIIGLEMNTDNETNVMSQIGYILNCLFLSIDWCIWYARQWMVLMISVRGRCSKKALLFGFAR